jgi:hypothetical protein
MAWQLNAGSRSQAGVAIFLSCIIDFMSKILDIMSSILDIGGSAMTYGEGRIWITLVLFIAVWAFLPAADMWL